MLLHSDAHRAVTLDPELETVEEIDLSPLVLGFAQKNFALFNRSMATNPHVHLTKGDARRVAFRREFSRPLPTARIFVNQIHPRCVGGKDD